MASPFLIVWLWVGQDATSIECLKAMMAGSKMKGMTGVYNPKYFKLDSHLGSSLV